MDALTEPIERVVEAGEWFVRTPELRLLYVTTDASLRNVVLAHLTANELLEPNTEAYFVLEAPTEDGDDGWTLRSDELRADWEGLVEGDPSGKVPGLWPEVAAATPLQRFCLELGEALARVGAIEGMTGLAITLAPVWIRDATRWQQDLAVVLREPRLGKARFVIVECDGEHTQPLVDALAAAAERVDARVDDAALREQMQQRVDAMKAAPAGATGPRLTGAAGPAVAPPARKSAKPPLTPAQKQALAAEVGIPAAFMDEQAMHRLRTLVVSAATMAQTDPTAAIAAQREARDFCVAQGMQREAVVNELVLGGYVLQAGASDEAGEVFSQAKTRASEAGMTELTIQSQMALAASLLVQKRVDDAILAYHEAGDLAAASQTGDSPAPRIMGVEAYRMAGQLLVSSGRDQDGANVFWRALAIGEGLEPEQRPHSSASEAARALAALCRKHQLHQQAESLDAQAVALEQPGA